MNDVTTIEANTTTVVATQEKAAQALLDLAQAYTIDSPQMAEAAAEDLGNIKAKLKELEDLRLSMTRPLDEAKKRIMGFFDRPKQMLTTAETTLKNAIGTWQTKERARLEAERRAQEEAARKERERIEAERRAAEEAAAAEAKRLREEAEAAQRAGDAAKAAQLKAAADTTTVVAQAQSEVLKQESESLALMAQAPAAAPAKLAGVSTREDWKAEVVDLMALVKAVAAGEASIELLEPNTKTINQRAKALKSEFRVPGIRVYTEQVMAARATTR